ncbi:hypothetical protein BDQ17DRAFT_1289183 [Cyathus striatus]|nr:hypothetical protein BDQ17DRAFT_1289183 [Cyathus striatus]
MNSNAWGPTGETPLDVLYDSTNIIGSTVICGFSYGIVFTMFCICFYYLVLQFKLERNRTRQAVFNMVYIIITFILATLYVAANARTTQLAYVNNRNFPGGPNQYAIYIFDQPVTTFGLVAFFAANWFTDALLIWRLWVIYQSTYYVKYVIILPGFLFLTSMGHTDQASQYLGVVAMLVESSALYTIWAIIFLGLYIVNHPVQYIFLASLAEVQVLAPLLIIFRVSRGRAWGTSTERTLTTIRAKSVSNRISIHRMNGSRNTSGTLDIELQGTKTGSQLAESF